MDYSRFQKIYANLPEKIRKEIVVLVDDRPYTWNSSYIEIVNDTTLGKRIFNKLVELEII